MPRYLLILLVQLTLGGLLSAQSLENIPVSNDYILRTWEIEDGLPSNRVLGIAQTPDGYLWLATLGGLIRFDGVRFTPFPKETTRGLESDRVQSVFTSHDGHLWVGLDRGGVARRDGDRFQVIAPVAPGTDPAGWTTSFAEDASGAVWFGYEAPLKVSRWTDGRLTAFTGRDGLAAGHGGAHGNEVRVTGHGAVWYANTDGCGVFDGTRFRAVDPEAGGFVHLTPTDDGGMWATRGTTLVRYHPDGTREIAADIGSLSVHVMMEDQAGNLWIGTNNAGLIRFRDGHLTKVPVAGGSVASLFEDREGAIWVGTQSGGLNRLHSRRFFLRQTKDGLVNDDTYSLCEDREGRLWLVGGNTMLVRSTDATKRSFSPPPGWLEWSGTMTVLPDPSGGVWVGTLSGLYHSEEDAFSRESVHEPVTALLMDRRKNLWVAVINGPLVRHRDEQDTREPEADGLTHVVALSEDSLGGIWAGTESGLLFQKSGERFIRVPLPGAQSGEGIRFIVPDGPNAVWIGASKGGLYRWRDGKVDRLPHKAGLPTDDLRSLIITPEGDFWVGTGRGLLRVFRSEIEAVMDGRKASLHCDTYGRDDGLPSVEFSLGFRGTTTRTADGHLWFATARGALEIVPPRLPLRSLPPLPVLIEEVRVGETAMTLESRSELMIPPLSSPLEIRYTLAHLSAPGRLRFRYRLVGLGDHDWISVGDQRTVTFTRLPPGTYRFEVSASDGDGSWSAASTASLKFTVRAAWWETVLFRAGLGAMGILALIWVVRKIVLLRVQTRIRKLEQAHALERERTRIARDIHDQLGANLTQIAITSKLLTLDPPEDVPAHSRELTAIAKRTAESLDEIVWAVNPHYDTIAALIEYLGMFAVDFLASARIACEVDVPEALSAHPLSSNVRHHLFLAVKEALNNIVKHSGAHTVHLQVGEDGGRLQIAVSDDGCGFAPGTETAGSNGIRNFRERMKELGGEFHLESSPGKGTRVVFTLPLPAGSS